MYYRPKMNNDLLPGVGDAAHNPKYDRRIDQYSAPPDWDEIHPTNILRKDFEHWFERFEFMIDDTVYTDNSAQFEQALFWETLKV